LKSKTLEAVAITFLQPNSKLARESLLLFQHLLDPWIINDGHSYTKLHHICSPLLPQQGDQI